MNADSLQQVWAWLLSLSKVQLIVLGGGLSLLVAVSKVMRIFFLLVVLVVFCVVFVPEIVKRYNASPLPAMIQETVRHSIDATQDPLPSTPEPARKKN